MYFLHALSHYCCFYSFLFIWQFVYVNAQLNKLVVSVATFVGTGLEGLVCYRMRKPKLLFAATGSNE